MEVDETKQLVVTDYTPTLDSSVETSSSLATWWSARQEDDLSAVVLTAVVVTAAVVTAVVATEVVLTEVVVTGVIVTVDVQRGSNPGC